MFLFIFFCSSFQIFLLSVSFHPVHGGEESYYSERLRATDDQPSQSKAHTRGQINVSINVLRNLKEFRRDCGRCVQKVKSAVEKNPNLLSKIISHTKIAMKV